MPALQMGLNRHLNAFHQSAPLLLQFLFAEFIQAYRQFQTIQSLIEEEQFNHSLFALMARFSGPSADRMKIFYWNPDNGTLSKLYFYAAFLSDQTKDEGFPPLEKNCHRCWMLGIRLIEAIEGQDLDGIGTAVAKLHRSMRQTAQDLVKAVSMLRDNENVLFFVLRHHAHLDVIYGPRFTSKLLSSLFPDGIAGAQAHIIDRYAARGFDKLADTIKDTFSNLP